MGSSRPGHFAVTIGAVEGGTVVLKAAAKDVAYLKEYVGRTASVDITPSSDSQHSDSPDKGKG